MREKDVRFNQCLTPGNKGIQIILTAVALLIAITYTLKGYWLYSSISGICFVISFVIGSVTILFCIAYKRLFFKIDFVVFIVFCLFAWLSSVLAYGLSYYFFVSDFFYSAIAILALYYVIQSLTNYEIALKLLTIVIVISHVVINLFILIHASDLLMDDPEKTDLFFGSFEGNRLSGLGNPNTLGMSATTLLMCSLFGFLNSKKAMKLYFGFTCWMGWFMLGLSGSLTSQFGSIISIFLLLSFVLLNKKTDEHGCSHNRKLVVAQIKSVIVTLVISVALFLSFLLPILVYKGIMSIIIHGNVGDLSPRILDDDGTVSGRSAIWIQCVKDSFSNWRLALFGTSSLNYDPVYVHGENGIIEQVHAHNIILEWLRKFGLIGLLIWCVPLFYWIKCGVRVLFDRSEKTSIRYLAAIAAGMLAMGMTEVVPFYPQTTSALTVPFFLICGLCVRLNRDREVQKVIET